MSDIILHQRIILISHVKYHLTSEDHPIYWISQTVKTYIERTRFSEDLGLIQEWFLTLLSTISEVLDEFRSVDLFK